MAIVHKQSLAEIIISAADARAIVALALANCIRQLSARRNQPVQHIDEGISVLLARQTGPHNGLDVRQRLDRLEHDGPHAVHHNNDVLARLRNRLHELVAVVPGVEVEPVAGRALDGDVPLARVGRDHHDGDICARDDARHAAGAVRGLQRDVGAVSARALVDGVVRRHEVRVLGRAGAPAHAQRAVVASPVDARVAALGVDHGGGADEGDLRGLLQREDAAVLEQHDAVAGHGADVLLVVALHVGLDVDGGVPRVLADEVPRREDALGHVVEARLGHLVSADGVVQGRSPEDVAAVEVATGHGHVHAVDGRRVGRVLRIPVGHDVARETELVFQDAIEDLVVLARPRAVNLVVRAHDGGDVGVDGVGKGPEVQLVEGAVVDVAAHGLAVALLLVGDVVLDGRLDAPGLDRLDGDGCGDALEIGVGAEAFPVTPTVGVLAQRSGGRSEEDVDAATLGLGRDVCAALADELNVPRRGGLYPRREGVCPRAEANAERAVLEAQLRVVDGVDPRRVADAWPLVPPDAGHDADFVVLR